MQQRAGFVALLCSLVLACAPEPEEPGPFAQAEETLWRQVNRSQQGSDGIFVQAQLRTFAYEIASASATAEREGLGQEQLEYRLRQLVHSYIDGTYPASDGTDINNLYIQYRVYVSPAFDPSNPLQNRVFDNWRSQYVRQLLDRIYDSNLEVLRQQYDERWGLTLYSRLVFIVYLNGEESALRPRIDDIGSRTFLVDEDGNRYAPSGLGGPYLYETDRPPSGVLEDEAVYRVCYPNRRADQRTPIVGPGTSSISLQVEGLGEEASRLLRWSLPFDHPTLDPRKLPTESERAAAESSG